jgi:hypothetical protein
MFKLSKTSKMPCESFSLPAHKSCIGTKDSQGNLKPVCANCYAVKGTYRWKAAQNLRDHNYKYLIKYNNYEKFEKEMIEHFDKTRNPYFRWFDSGDIVNNDMLYSLYKICQYSPHINHWIPTKTREILDDELFTKLESLENVTVRYSSPSVDGTYSSIHGSTVIQKGQKVNTSKVYPCPVGIEEDRKNCGDCRACWHDERVIAYTEH